MAIIRYLYDPIDVIKQPFERVLTEAEFTAQYNTFKPTSKEWQSIECVQSTVKANRGLGKYIPIHYRAELDSLIESKLMHELSVKASANILRQNPPVVKYDYEKIGGAYLHSLKEMGMSPEDQELKLD